MPWGEVLSALVPVGPVRNPAGYQGCSARCYSYLPQLPNNVFDEDFIVAAYVSKSFTPGSCMNLSTTLHDSARTTSLYSITFHLEHSPACDSLPTLGQLVDPSEGVAGIQSIYLLLHGLMPDSLVGGLAYVGST